MTNTHYNNFSVPSSSSTEVLRSLQRDAEKDRSWFERYFGYVDSVERLVSNNPWRTLAPTGLMLEPIHTAGAKALKGSTPVFLASTFETGNIYHNLITYAKGGKDAVTRGSSSTGSYALEKAKIVTTSGTIDSTDRRFVKDVEGSVTKAELAVFMEGRDVSKISRTAMSTAATRAKQAHEEELTKLIMEATAIPGTSTAKAGSIDAQLMGLSVANRIKAHDERLTFYKGLADELSASKPARSSSPPPSDTMVRRIEDAVKTWGSQFAQRNREVRSDGLVASFQKGMDPAEYVGRTFTSIIVDDMIPATANGLKTVDEWTGGVLFECLKYVDPGQYNTWARRFLRDTCGLPQTLSQNVGDAIQYTGEAALLLGTFGSSSATKTAQLAGKTVAIPELATTVNRTAKIAEFEMAVAGTGDRILYNLRAAANRGPYDPRAMEQLLRTSGAEVTSHTMPALSGRNVKLAGQRHPKTGIVFDQRGFPIFDDVAKSEVRISGDLGKMAPDAHKRAATRQLKADIDAGKIDRKLFNEIEWEHIRSGKARIGNYTWHHHQNPGRMQLVPTEIHEGTGHFGGNALWGIE
ncbi:MAG: HNH endonuclease [Holosporales bacterium]|nr:HNH endonuclease [Holosporales bacterium]